jgi:hypothetical protein
MEKLLTGLFSHSSPKLSVPTLPDEKKSPRKGIPDVKTKARSNSIHNISVSPDISNTVVVDNKRIEYFKLQDLSRGRFSHEVLLDVCWWPDELLTLLEILRISYADFINSYTSKASIFDVAIRKAIYFMIQDKYRTNSDIAKFVNSGQFDIQDNYLNKVICEDNCRMYELEDHHRSKNEGKHYDLTKALSKLIEHPVVSEGDSVMSPVHVDLVRTYVCIYNLKNVYAVIDDVLRSVLKSALDGTTLGVNLNTFFSEIITDMDNKIILNLKQLSDDQLFNLVYRFRDILSYAQYSTSSFNQVFLRGALLDDSIEPINKQVLSRIRYVYKYYLRIINDQTQKEKIITDHVDSGYDTIVAKTDEFNSRPRLITPRYSRRPDEPKSMSPIPGVFTINTSPPTGPEGAFTEGTSGRPDTFGRSDAMRHVRKSSVDALMSKRKTFMIKYAKDGTTIEDAKPDDRK